MKTWNLKPLGNIRRADVFDALDYFSFLTSLGKTDIIQTIQKVLSGHNYPVAQDVDN